ncbi:MAG: hypothetical protein GY713_02075 [Actinomycetia bacterium]|nr:hypothetical protein [Actinomycetes bacterium]
MTNMTRPLGRLTDQILDLDYGDEQERLRYYETYAIAIHLQLIALPAVGAVVIGVAGRSAAGPVLVMLGIAFASVLPGLIHLGRHSVRTELIAMSKRNRGYMVAYALSCLTLFVAVVLRLDGSLRKGFALGLGFGFAAMALAIRRGYNTDDTVDPEA